MRRPGAAAVADEVRGQERAAKAAGPGPAHSLRAFVGTYAVFIACALAGLSVHAALQLYPREALRLCQAVSLPTVLVAFIVLVVPKQLTRTDDDLAHVVIRAVGLAEHEQVVYESCIAFSSWSLSYLFVRRLLNPETHAGALEKFPMDALFGGLANAFACYMKHHITAARRK